MQSKKFTIQFLVIPDFVFLNEKMTFMAAKIYAFIHNYKMEEFFYGNDKLMELFKCSEDSVSRAIKLLKDEGYITTRFDGKKRYINDLYVTQRVLNFADADSAKVRMLDEAGDSAEVRTPNEASQAELIGNTNNKPQSNGNYPMRKKREEKSQVIGGWGSGKPRGNQPLKEFKRKGFANGENIV